MYLCQELKKTADFLTKRLIAWVSLKCSQITTDKIQSAEFEESLAYRDFLIRVCGAAMINVVTKTRHEQKIRFDVARTIPQHVSITPDIKHITDFIQWTSVRKHKCLINQQKYFSNNRCKNLQPIKYDAEFLNQKITLQLQEINNVSYCCYYSVAYLTFAYFIYIFTYSHTFAY